MLREALVAIGRSSDLAALPEAMRLTTRLAHLLPDLGIVTGVVEVTDFAPYLTLFGGQRDLAADFVRSAIGPVIDWDAAHGTELVSTMATFLDCEANLRRSAQELFVHVNTVKQRLGRISALLGEQWREPESAFRIRIATRLHVAARALRG